MENYVLLGIEPVPGSDKGEIFSVLLVGDLLACQEKIMDVRQKGSDPVRLLKIPASKDVLQAKVDAMFRAPYDTSQTGRWNLNEVTNCLQNPNCFNPPYQLISSFDQ